MLTLLTEGGREKCYNYFKTAQHGDITVTLKDEKGESEALQQSVTENFGFFGMDPPVPTNAEKRSDEDDKSGSGAIRHNTPAHLDQALRARLNGATVRRTIEVRRKSDGASVPPHVVTHIQYIRWPDFDIPPDPQCVIDLINETERAQQIGTDKNAPILVHCSAGVGRTGSKSHVESSCYICNRSERLLTQRNYLLAFSFHCRPGLTREVAQFNAGSACHRQAASAPCGVDPAGCQDSIAF